MWPWTKRETGLEKLDRVLKAVVQHKASSRKTKSGGVAPVKAHAQRHPDAKPKIHWVANSGLRAWVEEHPDNPGKWAIRDRKKDGTVTTWEGLYDTEDAANNNLRGNATAVGWKRQEGPPPGHAPAAQNVEDAAQGPRHQIVEARSSKLLQRNRVYAAKPHVGLPGGLMTDGEFVEYMAKHDVEADISEPGTMWLRGGATNKGRKYWIDNTEVSKTAYDYFNRLKGERTRKSVMATEAGDGLDAATYTGGRALGRESLSPRRKKRRCKAKDKLKAALAEMRTDGGDA